MQKKIVLDTCIVKDLLKYNKDKKQKVNNGIDIKKVYDYITTMEYDGVSKCYLTIYTFYEVLKDFKTNFAEEMDEFVQLLYPQTITSPNIRKNFDDYNLINLHLKSKVEQENVLAQLRDLVSSDISSFMSEIFVVMLSVFIRLLEVALVTVDVRKKRVDHTLSGIETCIYNMLLCGVRANIENGKHFVVNFLDTEYKKFMKIVDLELKELDKEKQLTYKRINALLINIINALKNNDYKNETLDGDCDMFKSYYERFKIYYSEKHQKTSELAIKEKYKDLIRYLVKGVWRPFGKEVMNEYFYENIEKLFFRVVGTHELNKVSKRNLDYGFGFDTNDIIDMHILRLCFKGKYLNEDLLVLTSDVRMREKIYKFLPSSKILYEKFGSTKS